MPENLSYLDRLYNEIGQYGDRLKATFGGRGGISQIIDNWNTTYQPSYSDSIAEQNRLRLQQAKEEYDLQANAGQLSEEEAFQKQAILENIGQSIQQLERRTGMPTAPAAEIMQQQAAMQPSVAIDPYAQYLQENAAALQGPYLPQNQYAAPTREEYQKYFIEGQAPPKAVLVNPPVQRTAMPATQQVQQAQPGAIPMPAEAPQEAMAAPQPRQQGPMTIGQRIAALPYEADRLEAIRKLIEQTRQNIFNNGLRDIERAYGDLGAPNAVNARQALEKKIDVNLPMPKPVEETAQYKSAEKNWEGGLRESRKRISFNIAQAQRAQELMEIDPNLALIHMRSNLIKPLNSILSNDAIQLSEMIIRYPDLMSAADLSQLGGKKLLNPTAIATKFLSLDEKVQQNIVEKFTSALVEANPQRFLETAINGINGYVGSFNKDLTDQVVASTSPNIAKQLGATFLEPLQNRQPKSEVQVIRPGQQSSAAVQQYTPEQARAELLRRQAARANQQIDLTGKQGF